MKLRIKGNTLRLRLTKSEVEYFGLNGYIEEETGFGNAVFTYCLQVANIDTLSASFENNNLIIFMPTKMANEWVATNLVSCSGDIITNGDKKLYLLVEKDFKCLDETAEDQSDNYENPLAHSKK